MYSIFQSPKNGWRNDGAWIDDDWDGLVDTLIEYAEVTFENKKSAELIAPHKFKDNYRCKANAETSHWLFLDIDDGDLDRDVERIVKIGIKALIYATPSHTFKSPRYRIVVPVHTQFPSELYKQAATGLDYAMGNIADSSKLGCDAWCFVPGRYECGDWFAPTEVNGDILTVAQWMALAPEDDYSENIVGNPIDWNEFISKQANPRVLSTISALNECILPKKLEEYARIMPGNGRTYGLFGLVLSTVQRAILKGYYPNEQEIAQLARDIDAETGGYHARKYPEAMKRYARLSAPNVIAMAQNNILQMDLDQ